MIDLFYIRIQSKTCKISATRAKKKILFNMKHKKKERKGNEGNGVNRPLYMPIKKNPKEKLDLFSLTFIHAGIDIDVHSTVCLR